MFPPADNKMKSVTRSIRNLPEDPAAPPPVEEKKPAGMSCPSCGAPFSLQAVSDAPPEPEPAPAPIPAQGSSAGPSF